MLPAGAWCHVFAPTSSVLMGSRRLTRSKCPATHLRACEREATRRWRHARADQPPVGRRADPRGSRSPMVPNRAGRRRRSASRGTRAADPHERDRPVSGRDPPSRPRCSWPDAGQQAEGQARGTGPPGCQQSAEKPESSPGVRATGGDGRCSPVSVRLASAVAISSAPRAARGGGLSVDWQSAAGPPAAPRRPKRARSPVDPGRAHEMHGGGQEMRQRHHRDGKPMLRRNVSSGVSRLPMPKPMTAAVLRTAH
jgi:hypothetical protein